MNGSPLRYPGGKSRAVKFISEYIPDVDVLVSPFFGGGSIELFCASKGMKIFGYDLFIPLVSFWKCLIENGDNLANLIFEKYYPLSKDRFQSLQKSLLSEKNIWQQAAIYFALNRSSFSGTVLRGGMSPNHPRFTENSINYLRELDLSNISVEYRSFEDTIRIHNEFMYLDPPYIHKTSLYGSRNGLDEFPHRRLRNMIVDRRNWILSYNDCGNTRRLYAGCNIIPLEWKYGMTSIDKSSSEILILPKSV